VTATQILTEGATLKWIRHLIYPGIAGMMIAITLGILDLLKSSPTAGIDLLKSWGPGFLLGLLAIAVVGTFLDKMTSSWQSSVDAQQRVAVALTQLAEKDDRDRDRMVTETQYMASRMDQTHQLVQSLGVQLQRIETKLEKRTGG
jgi:hypothetical protein